MLDVVPILSRISVHILPSLFYLSDYVFVCMCVCVCYKATVISYLSSESEECKGFLSILATGIQWKLYKCNLIEKRNKKNIGPE